MKLVANAANGVYLRSILPSPDAEVSCVRAAIAYGSDPVSPADDLVMHCVNRGVRLDLWMRYDDTVPVAVPLLKKLYGLASRGVRTRFIKDFLHSKVIWWQGYGAYVGSANYTDRAWNRNIEAGVFVPEDDLEGLGLKGELEVFFGFLEAQPDWLALTQDLIAAMSEYERVRREHEQRSRALREKRKEAIGLAPVAVDQRAARERHRESFRREWQDCIAIMDGIAKRLASARPRWLEEDVPSRWQVDQFLHAYYYNQVVEGRRHPVDEFHERNRRDPSAALEQQIEWWRATPAPPSGEDRTFHESAPLIHRFLTRDNVQRLTPDDVVSICNATHATRDYILKIGLEKMGLVGVNSMGRAERTDHYGRWIHGRRNRRGESFPQLLAFVLYGGEDGDIWRRIYDAAYDDSRAIGHYGLNSIAEVAGWARPEVCYPRNGRTSKALRALGFEVVDY